MTRLDPLLARRRAYDLLGAMIVDGLDAERLQAVRALPELAAAVPEGASLDDLAAEHYALFGHQVHPFAGVFLDAEGLVGGGTAAEVVRQAHAVVGLSCNDDPGPDHLGLALRVMAALTDAENDATEREADADAQTLRRWQRRVLDEALLPWMAPLWAAIAAQPMSVWRRALELSIGLLARHRAEDPSLPTATAVPEPAEPLATLLDQPRTGLLKVAEALTTPVRSGVYLARDDVAALARACELPQGFGGRKGMLERLLRGAADYGAVPNLVEQLGRLLAARDDTYAALATEPGLGPHVAPWRARVAQTREMLTRLADGARDVG
jgi:TorA maturation chaperone TorD